VGRTCLVQIEEQFGLMGSVILTDILALISSGKRLQIA